MRPCRVQLEQRHIDHCIQPLRLEDCAVLAQSQWQGALSPWSIDDLKHYCDQGRRRNTSWVYWGAGNQMMGYLLSRLQGEDVELERIFIAPAYRRQSVALALLQHWIKDLSKEAHHHQGAGNPSSAWLEVSASNHAAIRCYQKLGFEVVYQRPNYYPATDDQSATAWVMRLQLTV